MIRIDKTGQRETQWESMNRSPSLRRMTTNSRVMIAQILLERRVRPQDLLVVTLRVSIVSPPAAQPTPNIVGVEMLLILRQSRGVMCADEPRCHPILYVRGRQMGYTGVDVVPFELAASPLSQRRLCIRIELAEVMESRRGDDCVDKPRPRLVRVHEHRVGPLFRALLNCLDVPGVRIAGYPFARR
jgi:hypothetical protein